MSISVVNRGRLWGLIACHHCESRTVPFAVRSACDFIAQILSLQIETHERAAEAERRVTLKSLESRLLTSMAGHGADYAAGLVENKQALLDFADAGGAAVIAENETLLVGRTPDERTLAQITQHLARRGNWDVFTTDCLASEFPFVNGMAQCPAGMAAISVSKLHPSFVLWFRDEQATTVHWAGDPPQAAESTGSGTIAPAQVVRSLERNRSRTFRTFYGGGKECTRRLAQLDYRHRAANRRRKR